jgi:hypothetical protein
MEVVKMCIVCMLDFSNPVCVKCQELENRKMIQETIDELDREEALGIQGEPHPDVDSMPF